MSLPHLLLVDDSEAILAFERAALSGHYRCSSATNGVEALRLARELTPAAILLDLSMPEMDGDEVLARLQLDEHLASIPVIIISSERERAEICLKQGAVAFLPKPIQADTLVMLVRRVLAEAERARQQNNIIVLGLTAGDIEFAVPLSSIRQVLPQLATSPLALGPRYLNEFLELNGEAIFILDVPRRLGLAHSRGLADRKLVVLNIRGVQLALCVDEVRDPEEIEAVHFTPRERVGGAEHGLLEAALVGMARTERGLRPILDPSAFLSKELIRRLQTLRQVAA